MSNQLRIRPVVGYEDYYMVSSEGNVFSKTRLGGKVRKYRGGQDTYITKTIRGRWLKLQYNDRGYRHVSLANTDGIAITSKVHRLVAMAFIPNSDNKPHINHLDSDRANNHVENLEWCTPSENITHAYNNNRMNIPRGESRHNSRLKWVDVERIRELWSTGRYSQKNIASLFKIDPSNVSRIVNNKWWRI